MDVDDPLMSGWEGKLRENSRHVRGREQGRDEKHGCGLKVTAKGRTCRNLKSIL